MMSGYRKSASGAIGGRTTDDICRRPVTLNEIKIRGRYILQFVAEISHDCHGL